MAERATMSDWFAIGREAAREGRRRVPAHDPRIAGMLESEPCEAGSPEATGHMCAMVAWLEGYDSELRRQMMLA